MYIAHKSGSASFPCHRPEFEGKEYRAIYYCLLQQSRHVSPAPDPRGVTLLHVHQWLHRRQSFGGRT